MLKLNYEYINRNTPLTFVFLHGWGCSKNYWNKVIMKLNEVSILNIDLFGFGSSSEPYDYFDTYEYAYQIFLLLKKLNINKIVLVGHSFGGRLSILLSSIFDLDVSICVLTSCAGLNRFNLTTWLKIKIYKVGKFLARKGVLKVNAIKQYGSVDYLNSNDVQKRVLVRVVNQDLTIFLERIRCKTVLVWDKKDRDTPYWICKRMYKKISNAEIVLYNTGKHFTYYFNYNKFAKLLNKFIL